MDRANKLQVNYIRISADKISCKISLIVEKQKAITFFIPLH